MNSKIILTIVAIILLVIGVYYYVEIAPVRSEIGQSVDALEDALDREEYTNIPSQSRPATLQTPLSFDREEYALLVYNPSLSSFDDFSLECLNNPSASISSYEVQGQQDDSTVVKLYIDFQGSQGIDICTLSILDSDQIAIHKLQETAS